MIMQHPNLQFYRNYDDDYTSCSLSDGKLSSRSQFDFRSFSSVRFNRLAICLDLDNTLIFSTTTAPPLSDFIIRACGEDIFVIKRPYLDHFLSEISKIADIYLFTSAEKEYADQILEYLDPLDTIFKKKFYRDSCKYVNGVYVKDLSVCGVDLSKIAIVDDYINSCLTPSNRILVRPFFGYPNDNELNRVSLIIKQFLYVKDIRTVLNK